MNKIILYSSGFSSSFVLVNKVIEHRADPGLKYQPETKIKLL